MLRMGLQSGMVSAEDRRDFIGGQVAYFQFCVVRVVGHGDLVLLDRSRKLRQCIDVDHFFVSCELEWAYRYKG